MNTAESFEITILTICPAFLENMGIIPINNQALDLPRVVKLDDRVVKPDDVNKSPQELLEEVQSLRVCSYYRQGLKIDSNSNRLS